MDSNPISKTSKKIKDNIPDLIESPNNSYNSSPNNSEKSPSVLNSNFSNTIKSLEIVRTYSKSEGNTTPKSVRQKFYGSDEEEEPEADDEDEENNSSSKNKQKKREIKVAKRRGSKSDVKWTFLSSYTDRTEFELHINNHMIRVLRTNNATGIGPKKLYYCKECTKSAGAMLYLQYSSGVQNALNPDIFDCYIIGDSIHSHFEKPGVNYSKLIAEAKSVLPPATTDDADSESMKKKRSRSTTSSPKPRIQLLRDANSASPSGNKTKRKMSESVVKSKPKVTLKKTPKIKFRKPSDYLEDGELEASGGSGDNSEKVEESLNSDDETPVSNRPRKKMRVLDTDED